MGATQRLVGNRLPIAVRHGMVRRVQIVVVSSPGDGGALHWSHQLAGEFAQLAIAKGATVRWLAALHRGQELPFAASDLRAAGLELSVYQNRRELPLNQIATSQLDVSMEAAVTDCLRAEPLASVVHLGLGGQGTPNVLWLSDRLGSRTFACARGVELLCHRGDLVDRDRRVCTDWSDPERCRWCCSVSRFGRPTSNDLRNRVDLFIAGLQTCESILVPASEDVALVTSLGLAAKQIAVGVSATDLLARVFAAVP